MSDLNAVDEIREKIRNAGMRATAARISVMQVLMKATSPMSHGEVFEKLDGKGFDRATLYRNLIDLADARILRRADMGDHVWRFEMMDVPGEGAQQIHPHFICGSCGNIQCLPTASVKIQPQKGTPKAIVEKNIEVHIKGLCNTCS